MISFLLYTLEVWYDVILFEIISINTSKGSGGRCLEFRFMKAWPYLDKESRYFVSDVNRVYYQQSFFFFFNNRDNLYTEAKWRSETSTLVFPPGNTHSSNRKGEWVLEKSPCLT